MGGTRRRRLPAALAGALVIGSLACSPPIEQAAASSPNVVLISVDSLRADHVGAYGYRRDTSPNLDRLAAESMLFENAVSTTTWTLPAHASMLTGLYPEAHGVVSGADRLSDDAVLVAEIFGDAGYATRAVVAAPYLNRAFGFDQGWDRYDDVTGTYRDRPENRDSSHWGTTSPEVQRRALAALDDIDGRPFFLFVHYWDVHYDYAPPVPFDTEFDPGYAGEITAENFAFNDRIHRGMPRRDRRHIVALYDGEIAYTDGYIGRLLDSLRERGLWDTTLIVVTADHGDEFFEHGDKGHENNLFAPTLNVPLIVKLPGGEHRGARVAAAASIVDIAPTVLAVAGLPAPPIGQGRDLRALLAPGGPSRALFASLEHYGSAVIRDGLKLVTRPDARRPGGVSRRLYDLDADPRERHDVAELRPADRDALWSNQRRWLESASQMRDLAESVGDIDPAVLERLRRLGYVR